MDCPLCANDNRDVYEALVLHQNITLDDVANRLHCSVDVIQEHFDNHVGDDPVMDQSEMLDRVLQDLFGRFILSSQEGDTVTKHSVDMLTSLAKEIRNYISEKNRLEGKFEVKAKQLQIELKKLESLIFSTLCESCRDRILEKLDAEG